MVIPHTEGQAWTDSGYICDVHTAYYILTVHVPIFVSTAIVRYVHSWPITLHYTKVLKVHNYLQSHCWPSTLYIYTLLTSSYHPLSNANRKSTKMIVSTDGNSSGIMAPLNHCTIQIVQAMQPGNRMFEATLHYKSQWTCSATSQVDHWPVHHLPSCA